MYIALPYELDDVYNNGEITDSMFEVMRWLHRKADWSTGKVKMVSAKTIYFTINGRAEIRTLQDALQNLAACGWITTHRLKGQRGSYWVTIHNFVALTGAQKDQVLNPKTVTPYKNGEPLACAEECGEGAKKTALTTRRQCGDSAPLQNNRDSESTDFTESTDQGRKEGRKERLRSLRSLRLLAPLRELIKRRNQQAWSPWTKTPDRTLSVS
jgi:hypothetical protein